MVNKIWAFMMNLDLLKIGAYLLVFVVLERLVPAETKQRWRGLVLNVGLTLVFVVGTALYGSAISAAVIGAQNALWGGGWIDLRFASETSYVSQIAGGLLFFLAYDFFYYWCHRLQHEVPALWAEHKLHHLDENLNVTTTLRHHWLEALIRLPLVAIPLAVLFKLDPLAGGVLGAVYGAWGYFIHANLRLSLGPLTPVICGPQIHRIHHSKLPPHLNKNYAAFFPVWDFIFGTYYRPKHDEFPPTGVEGEVSIGLIGGVALPFVEWARMIQKKPAAPADPGNLSAG
jgi:sterol desaturase/sphingolipid hydroxylase (fatty acid hydroxylase superfamily)